MGGVETGAGHATAEAGLEREWWLRTLAVFASPVSTFAALRDPSGSRADAREERSALLLVDQCDQRVAHFHAERIERARLRAVR